MPSRQNATGSDASPAEGSSHPRSLAQRAWFLPLALAVLTLIFAGHLLALPPGEALPGGDFENIHYPLLKFVVASVREEGIVPLWNPHQFLGYSVVGNPQYGLFYPFNWLLLAYESTQIYQSVALVVALHVFIAAWGMATLARAWDASPEGALLAGILFGFGGVIATRIIAGHYALLLSAAWLPWVMAGYEWAVRRGDVHAAAQHQHENNQPPGRQDQQGLFWLAARRLPLAAVVGGGVALALSILAGHPQMVYLILLALAIQWGYHLLAAPDRAARWLCTRPLMLIGLVGLLLSAVSWLPLADYLPKTGRDPDTASLAFANEHAIPANRLLTLAIPDLFGTRLTDPAYWGGMPFHEEASAYVGWLPLLALLLIPALRERRVWLLAALIAVGLLLSLGADGALNLALYRLLPLVRNFRAPGRALALSTVGFAGLAALAVTRLSGASPDERRAMLRPLTTRLVPVGLVALWGGALLLTIFGAALQDETARRVAFMAKQVGLSGVFLALVGVALWAWSAGEPARRWALALTLLIGLLDVWHIGWGYLQTGHIELSPIWREASVDVPTGPEGGYGRVMQMYPPPGIPNGASWTGHQSIQGYDPVFTREWLLLSEAAGWDPGHPLNRVMGLRYVLTRDELDAYGFAHASGFELAGIRLPFLFYENPDALPRAYLVERVVVVPDQTAALDLMAQGGEIDQGAAALLEADPGCALSGSGGTARIVDYQPNQVTVQVRADGPGLLVLSDQYDDDWQVEIDGEPADLLRADIALRGVCVPDGTHTVRFVYRPWAFYVGGALSALSALALLIGAGGLAIAVFMPRRRVLA